MDAAGDERLGGFQTDQAAADQHGPLYLSVLHRLANRQRVIGQIQAEHTVEIRAFQARLDRNASRGQHEFVVG